MKTARTFKAIGTTIDGQGRAAVISVEHRTEPGIFRVHGPGSLTRWVDTMAEAVADARLAYPAGTEWFSGDIIEVVSS